MKLELLLIIILISLDLVIFSMTYAVQHEVLVTVFSAVNTFVTTTNLLVVGELFHDPIGNGFLYMVVVLLFIFWIWLRYQVYEGLTGCDVTAIREVFGDVAKEPFPVQPTNRSERFTPATQYKRWVPVNKK